jgi:hypothetical protein
MKTDDFHKAVGLSVPNDNEISNEPKQYYRDEDEEDKEEDNQAFYSDED